MNELDLTLSLEDMVRYPLYYRQHGVRMPMQLVAPPISSLETLGLPMQSVLHYIADDETVYGIAQDEPILKDTHRLIMVEHITELGDERGHPIKLKLSPGTLTRGYHRKYRKTRPLYNFAAAAGNPLTLIVENYALLPHLNRYLNNFFRPFNKWWNIQATMWKQVSRIAQISDRQQYLQCHLPKILPSLMQLRKAEQGLTRATLTPFRSAESLMVLELWKWLGAARQDSVLSFCPPQHLSKMNLIWIDETSWFVINLGLLDQWRKTPDQPNGKIDPVVLQKRFLRLLMTLMDMRTPAPDASVGMQTVMKTDTPEVTEQTAQTTQQPEQSQDTLIDSEPSAPLTVKVPTASGKTVKIEMLKGQTKPLLVDIDEDEIDFSKIDAQIEKDLEALETLNTQYEKAIEEGRRADADEQTVERVTPVQRYQPTQVTPEQAIMEKVNTLAEGGLLSAAEYRRFIALSTAFKQLPNPYRPDEPIEQAMTIDHASLTIEQAPAIVDKPTVIDKSMLGDRLKTFDTQYIKNVLQKDMLSMVNTVQKAGIAINGYQIEDIQTALSHTEKHTLNLVPVQGKPSTITFEIPKIQEDGTYLSGNVKYRLRKMRGDVPIRKVSPSKVALTSYYSKIYVSRSEKQTHHYANWITNKISAIGIDFQDTRINHLMLSNVFDSKIHVPRIYSTLAMRFRSFYMGELFFFFDYHARVEVLGDQVPVVEKGGMVAAGLRGKDLIVVDANDFFYVAKEEDLEPLGTMESLLGLEGRSPLEMIEVKIFSKLIPLGIVLGYRMGLSKLVGLLNTPYRVVPLGERAHVSSSEYALYFEDQTWVFQRDNRLAASVLSGFANFEKFTQNYASHLFDHPDIYLNLLESVKLGVRYLREIDLQQDLFIDPITFEILQEMKEPTDYLGLLLRAAELLQTDWSPDETDMAYMRIKGYERVAGNVYSELVKAIRVYRARGGVPSAKVELHPYAVWQSICEDSSVKQVEDSNPINNVKEKEEVTYSGTGGRGSRSMVGRTRIFHENDLGVISEATKDSADVAITTFLTADPNLKNLRGMTQRADLKSPKPAQLMSSSAMVGPALDRDDLKRVVFASIQQSSGTFAKGYRPTPLRTGYEQVVANRADEIFAYQAEDEGIITAITPRTLTVTYQDGRKKAVELGRRFGSVSAMTLPHELVTEFKVGDRVNPGDILVYNSRYFEKDYLNPSQVVLKTGCVLNVALMETSDTLEDSCAISERAADLLETQTTEIRNIVVEFSNTIHSLINVGTHVEVDDILCTIEDPVTAQNSLFDEDALDTLRTLAANNPKAKVTGVVEKIEVFYHGDFDDLSASLQDIAARSDSQRKRLARELGVKYTSGQVDGSLNIDRKTLAFNHAVIRVYITSNRKMQVGDKAVFGNQLKTIVGRVMGGVNRTESGLPIDAIFGYLSVSDRIVRSPEIWGTTNRLMHVITDRAIAVYRKGK